MKKTNILKDLKPKITNFLSKNPNWIIIITWPTASWKTWISVDLANYFWNVEIVSADSRQVYKYMDIATDKISKSIRSSIRHYQIDIIDPDENYTVWQRKKSTNKIIDSIQRKWNIPFVVWWTWLYISSLYKNYDIPEVSPDYNLRWDLEDKEKKESWYLHKYLSKIDPKEANKIHPNSTRHIIRAIEIYEKTWNKKSDLSSENPVDRPILLVLLWPDKNISNKLIKDRVVKMYEKWLIEETKFLLDKWYDLSLQSMNWIWYKETVYYLDWLISLDECVDMVSNATIKFAKRQRTWFRSYIKDYESFPKDNVKYEIYNVDL